MTLVNGRPDFDEQFFSKNTSVSKGTDIFTLGGDFFSVKTNLENRNVRNLSQYIDAFSQPVTYDDIIRDDKVQIDTISSITTAELNFDKSELTNFSYFGSLEDNIKYNISYIVDNFPASLYVNSEYNNVLLTVMDYTYDENSNIASFKVPTAAITNNYNLNYERTQNVFLGNSEDLRILSASYAKYLVWNFDDEFPVINFTGSTVTDTYIYLNVKGNPFPSIVTNGLAQFHIKPNYDYYNGFLENLNDFQSYLLNRDSTPKYTAIFKIPNYDNEGNTLLIDEAFTWKTTDGYNLDYDTYEFETYSEALINIAKEYDDYKTNLISRYLTSSSIKEFDTEDQKAEKLFRMYGKEFDDIKKYIDGLANLTKISYDKKDNMPDILVKNFARTLGWGTFSTVTETDLMNSVLGQDNDIIFSGTTKNLTPVETDIELWRRLVINSAFLFRSKGTRNCIDFLFRIIGAPQSLIDFNEYVYIAQNKIDVDNVLNNDDLNLPFDEEGYPKTLDNTTDNYFQMKGGWISNKEIAPTNDKNYLSVIGIHTGDYDNGSSYFNQYKDFNGSSGFQLERTIDNIKSWKLTATERKNDDKLTNYNVEDHRLVLNSKEASIFLNIAKPVETDVYEYNKATGYVINSTGITSPYPDTQYTRGDVSKMSFIQYIDFIYTNYINAKNRKVIQTNGNGYPTLKKLYEDYYAVSDKKLDTDKVIKFIEQIGDFWINLIEQFVPSTTIWQGGVVYKNLIFDRQKFDYKQGENDGSEFETEQLENSDIKIYTTIASGSIHLPYIFNITDIAKVDLTYNSNLSFPDNSSGDDTGGGGDPIPGNVGSGSTTVNKTGILRVKPYFDNEILSLIEPCIEMDKVSKIVTGTTAPIIHNISDGLKEVDFIFDCNVDMFLSGATFKYDVYPYNGTAFTTPSTYSKTFSSFTPTGSTLVVNENINDQFIDGDYLIKPAFKFTVSATGETYSNIYQYINQLNILGITNNTGFTLDTNGNLLYDSTNTTYTSVFGIYNADSDYWFSIVSDPYLPVIKLSGFDTPNLSGSTLVNEQILVEADNQHLFMIDDLPSGDIFLNLNGNTLLKSIEPDFSDGGEYYTEIIGPVYQINIKPDLLIIQDDILNIIYLKSAESEEFSTIIDEIDVIPSGTTHTGNGIFYNTDTSKYEYYFDFKINDEVDFHEMVVVLNGNKLLPIIDYYPSNDDPYKIIFAGIINIDDIILVYYPTISPDLYYLSSKQVVISWSVQNDYHSGTYTVQIATDEAFSSIVLTGSTPYITGSTVTLNNYDLYVGDITTPNMRYYYRIKSDKNNYNLFNEKTITTIYSSSSYFLTDNRVLI